MKDYYEILEINRDATEEEIKKSYRKLAIKWHPDKNPNNREEAEKRFKEISEAYQILNDTEKRQIYDNYGEDGIKNHDQGMHSGGMSTPDDIFQMFFGGASPFSSDFGERIPVQKVKPKVIEVPISLKELYNGTKKKITLKLTKTCVDCKGFGGSSIKFCNDCGGKGVKMTERFIGPGMIQRAQMQCKKCEGTGKMIENKCKECNGKKTKLIEEQFIIEIEKGSFWEDNIILQGKGDEIPIILPNAKNQIVKGDIIFILKESNNTLFTRVGDDLYFNYSIKLGDSIGGCNVELTNINEEKISYLENNIIFENSYNIIYNKGMPTKNTPSKYGNLYIIYNISYPDKELTEEEKKIIKAILPSTPFNNIDTNISRSQLKHNISIENIKKMYIKQKNQNNPFYGQQFEGGIPGVFNRFF